jgi:protein ImuB
MPALQSGRTAGKMPSIDAGKMPALQSGRTAGKMPSIDAGKMPALQSGRSEGKMPSIHAGKMPALQSGRTEGKMPSIHAGKMPALQSGRTEGKMPVRLTGETSVLREPLMALVAVDHGRSVVAHCCPRCLQAGVRPGMTLAHARALAGPELYHQSDQPRRQADSLAALAQWAMQFSPVVAVDGQDALVMDITGCQRLFGGEDAIVAKVACSLERLGLASRVAVASTLGCAWAMARFGDTTRAVAPPGGEWAILARLPVECLRLEREVSLALAEVGVATVEQMAALPRESLARRFGPGCLRRLDQALGKAWERVEGLPAARPIAVGTEFAGPVKQPEALAAGVRVLLDRLSTKLAARQLGARRVELSARRADMPPVSVSISLSRPSLDAKHLWKLIEAPLEKLDMGFGVDSLIMRAADTGLLEHRQRSFLPQEAAAGIERDRELCELADVLSSRLGPQSVSRIEPVESHVPELAFVARSVLESGPERLGTKKGRAQRGQALPQKRGGASPLARGDRPSVLFDRPQRVDVMTVAPEGPVMHFAWMGRQFRVAACAGPERIAGQWWSDGNQTRDYYRVADAEGLWLWIFRVRETGHWFVHGIWA